MDYTELMVGCFHETVSRDGAPSMLVKVAGSGSEETGTCTVYETGTSPVSWTAIEDAARFLLAALKQPERTRNVTLRVEVPLPGSVYETFDGGSPFLLMAARRTAVVNPAGEPMHNAWFPNVKCQSMKDFVQQVFAA
ncbi:hypothetical protein HDU90_003228 [Geranomyces variabilis]|nr:hypothetical protein HDU90_003228 [Geranomyces variabilis]